MKFLLICVWGNYRMLSKKIDFLFTILAENCNPNGDPLAGNAPRIDDKGYGMITDVCIKRKIRNRMQDMGHAILLKADNRTDDGAHSVKSRLSLYDFDKDYKKDPDGLANAVCETFLDVRSFGQVLGFKSAITSATSYGIKGPVTIQHAFTINSLFYDDIQITKSINLEGDDRVRDSTTMGMKHIIKRGVYVCKGSINTNLAHKTGFSDQDAEIIKECIKTLFENDESSSRPGGSMAVCDLFWWEHEYSSGSHPSMKVFNSIDIVSSDTFPYYKIKEKYDLEHVKLEHYNLI